MKIQLYCQEETADSFMGKSGQRFPLTLTLRDDAPDYGMKELVEMRFEGAEKERLVGKCKGHVLIVAQRRIAKFNGISRIEGEVIEILPKVGVK